VNIAINEWEMLMRNLGIVLTVSLMLSACVQDRPYDSQYHSDAGYVNQYHSDVTSGYNSDYNTFKRAPAQPPLRAPGSGPVNSGYSSS
jgi:hypothetical protein